MGCLMPYFPVDDQFAFHSKVVAAGNAAIGLWTRAGSWCKSQANGGFVPEEMISALGTKVQAMRLVSVNLWLLVPGGFRFHDWEHQSGNHAAEEEKRRRDLARERQRRYRERNAAGDVTVTVTTSVSDASVTLLPSPSPSHLVTDTQISPVPERESSPQGPDEFESIEALCTRQAGALGVEFLKVKQAIGKHAGRFPEPTGVMRIIAVVLERASLPVKSPTGLVVTAIRNDWAEWQKFLDAEVA